MVLQHKVCVLGAIHQGRWREEETYKTTFFNAFFLMQLFIDILKIIVLLCQTHSFASA